MCSFPKDPTGGLFDFNKDGKLDAAEYSMTMDALGQDQDEDSDEREDSDLDDMDDDLESEYKAVPAADLMKLSYHSFWSEENSCMAPS